MTLRIELNEEQIEGGDAPLLLHEDIDALSAVECAPSLELLLEEGHDNSGGAGRVDELAVGRQEGLTVTSHRALEGVPGVRRAASATRDRATQEGGDGDHDQRGRDLVEELHGLPPSLSGRGRRVIAEDPRTHDTSIVPFF